MTPSLIADVAFLAILVLAAFRGWRVGAVRTLVGIAAALLGVYLAAVGRGPLTALISTALPAVDPLLIGAFAVVGGAWLFIWIGSWLLGATLRALLRMVRLGALDTLLGGLLGLVQGVLVVGALVFVADAVQSFGGTVGAVASVSTAISTSTAATLARSDLFPLIETLIGGWLPEALRNLLLP